MWTKKSSGPSYIYSSLLKLIEEKSMVDDSKWPIDVLPIVHQCADSLFDAVNKIKEANGVRD